MNEAFEARLTSFLTQQDERERAFNDLFSELAEGLRPVVLRALGHPGATHEADVDEVVQETLLRLWQGRASFSPEKGPAWTWLCTVARRAAIDHLRRKHRRPHEESLYDEDGDLAVDRFSSETDPPWMLVEPELLPRLQAILSAEAYRVIRLYLGGLKDREIAEVLEIKQDEVRSLRQRSIARLRSEPFIQALREDRPRRGLVESEVPRQRLLRHEPAKLRISFPSSVTRERSSAPGTAKQEVDGLVRRLYCRFGLIPSDPSSPPEINWDEFERVLFGSYDDNGDDFPAN